MREADATAIPSLDDVLRAVGGWGAALADVDVAAKREVLGVLIDRVVHRRVGHGRYEAQLEWTATGELLRKLAVATQPAAYGTFGLLTQAAAMITPPSQNRTKTNESARRKSGGAD